MQVVMFVGGAALAYYVYTSFSGTDGAPGSNSQRKQPMFGRCVSLGLCSYFFLQQTLIHGCVCCGPAWCACCACTKQGMTRCFVTQEQQANKPEEALSCQQAKSEEGLYKIAALSRKVTTSQTSGLKTKSCLLGSIVDFDTCSLGHMLDAMKFRGLDTLSATHTM